MIEAYFYFFSLPGFLELFLPPLPGFFILPDLFVLKESLTRILSISLPLPAVTMPLVMGCSGTPFYAVLLECRLGSTDVSCSLMLGVGGSVPTTSVGSTASPESVTVVLILMPLSEAPWFFGLAIMHSISLLSLFLSMVLPNGG